jgi:hypothetical protein
VTELRRRGVQAALVVYQPPGSLAGRAQAPGSFHFVVNPDLLAARQPEVDPPTGQRAAAVYPSQVRSLVDIIERLDDPLVLSGPAIVGSFAYDRTQRDRVDYEPSVLPTPSLAGLGTLRWPLHRVDWLPGDLPEDVQVWATGALNMELPELTRHVLGSFLAEAWRRTEDLVERWGVSEAHIADHHHVGSGLLAGAVRDRGGRVVVWPHSSNPVHVNARPAGSIHTAVAVTRGGAAQWRAAHPQADVEHAPDLMFDWAEQRAPVDPDGPLNVVLLGGKPMLGFTPFVDVVEHDRLVAAFVHGMLDLAQELPLQLWFKPKGGGRAGVGWLDSLVDGRRGYGILREHPLRISLPNLVFATVSLGSTAIYEGMSRGIPGMVVRDFDVSDYTTLGDKTVPVVDVPGAALTLRSWAPGVAYDTASWAAASALIDELGTAPSWDVQLTR